MRIIIHAVLQPTHFRFHPISLHGGPIDNPNQGFRAVAGGDGLRTRGIALSLGVDRCLGFGAYEGLAEFVLAEVLCVVAGAIVEVGVEGREGALFARLAAEPNPQ